MIKDESHIRPFSDSISPMISDLQNISRMQLDDIKSLINNAVNRKCRDLHHLEELADLLLDVAFVLPEAKSPFFELLNYIRSFDTECADDYERIFNEHTKEE